MIMGGSQHNIYFPTASFFDGFHSGMGKLNATEVRRTSLPNDKSNVNQHGQRHFADLYKSSYMTGKRYGGFIFDTQALHSASMDSADFPNAPPKQYLFL